MDMSKIDEQNKQLRFINPFDGSEMNSTPSIEELRQYLLNYD